MKGDDIISAVTGVTSKWARVRKAQERRTNGEFDLLDGMLIGSDRMSIKAAAWKVMESAYLKASSNGEYPALARQIMYAARPDIQGLSGKDLDDDYFTQTLLPDYIEAHPEAADWDMGFDARGHFEEPHTEVIVPLGTLDVRNYLDDVDGLGAEADLQEDKPELVRTCGPEHRFGAVLFIEKEGFMPLFKASRLAERYDVAIMSTKGVSNTASRLLVDRLCGQHDIPLLVLHDFDKAGFSIVGTLRRDNRRYTFTNDIRVIDLGLHLEDVEAYHLQSEEVKYGSSDPTLNLMENGATDEEIAFLCEKIEPEEVCFQGRRVELNAFTSGDLIAWIESKLQEHGIKKVIPDDETLRDAYRSAVERRFFKQRAGDIAQRAKEEAERVRLPKKLTQVIRQRLEAEPALSWDQVIAELAAEAL